VLVLPLFLSLSRGLLSQRHLDAVDPRHTFELQQTEGVIRDVQGFWLAQIGVRDQFCSCVPGRTVPAKVDRKHTRCLLFHPVEKFMSHHAFGILFGYFGRRAVRAAAFVGNRIRFNYQFDGPDYILPTEYKLQEHPDGAPVDLANPDVGSLVAWNTIRLAVGRGARNTWLRSVASLVLMSRTGPAGPWHLRVTHHGSQVRTSVLCHRDGSDYIITCHSLQNHIRVKPRSADSVTSRTMDDIAQWHESARAGSQIAANNFEIDDHDPDGVQGTAVKVEDEMSRAVLEMQQSANST
jgi:hypothetical protein